MLGVAAGIVFSFVTFWNKAFIMDLYAGSLDNSNMRRGGDLYLDELRFDSPERFITRARLGKLWKLW
eukprot:COSAG05_NODE_162_length_15499_cov_23.006104_7_plen_67_part_00